MAIVVYGHTLESALDILKNTEEYALTAWLWIFQGHLPWNYNL